MHPFHRSQLLLKSCLVGALSIALVACSSAQTSSDSTPEPSSPPSTPSQPESVESSSPPSEGDSGAFDGPVLSAIKEAGIAKIGVKTSTVPFGYIPEGKSDPVGLDIDLAHAIADNWGVDVELVPVTSANRVAMLQTKKVDFLVASIVDTPEREKTISFTIPYFKDQMKILVPDSSSVTSLDDLSGKTVAAAQGSVQVDILNEQNPKIKVLQLPNWSSALQALASGKAEALFGAVSALADMQKSSAETGVNLKIVGEDGVAEVPYAIAVRKSDGPLRDKLDSTLIELQDDGEYQAIFEKWLGDLYSEPQELSTTSDS